MARKNTEELLITLHLWKQTLKNMGPIISPSDDGWPAEVVALAKCLFDLDGGVCGVRFHFEASTGLTSPRVGVQASCSFFDIAVLAAAVVAPCGV